jgi:hypothetical protein
MCFEEMDQDEIEKSAESQFYLTFRMAKCYLIDFVALKYLK